MLESSHLDRISRLYHITIASVSLSTEIVGYLDSLLRVREIPDDPRALNGLQVANSGTVRRIGAAVDACQASIDAAVASGCDFLLAHHGLFWGGLEPLTGRHGRRVRALVAGDVALYSAHIPLDCHPEVGNNAVIARQLSLTNCKPFGEYRGILIGVEGNADTTLAEFTQRVERVLKHPPRVIQGGPERVTRVAVVSGAASDLVRAAHQAGIDTFLTGEGPHHTYFDAEELGVTVLYGGHYATETAGVRELARHLSDRYGIPWQFLDHPTGL